MLQTKRLDAVRKAARAYEERLPATQRKRLGQYFSGLRVGKLLAHLALEETTRTVLDPMAGNGDLLDAACEAARELAVPIRRLDGVELDQDVAATCRKRLQATTIHGRPARRIVNGDALDPVTINALPAQSYDLVITNPPYVRRCRRSGEQHRNVLKGLNAIARERTSNTHTVSAEAKAWQSMIDGISGLADLSVPSWMLAAAMVRPGGRLALVAPETWHSRDYANILRCLMLDCFRIEWVVEDLHCAWFPEASVRTHLIVARRHVGEISSHTQERTCAAWIRLSADANDGRSLVGHACPGAQPEGQFAAWLRRTNSLGSAPATAPLKGVEYSSFDLHRERAVLEHKSRRQRWYRKLKGSAPNSHVSSCTTSADPVPVPGPLANLIPGSCSLTSLDATGIAVGQGLRTGCNGFFHVDASAEACEGSTWIQTSALLGSKRLRVPNATLRCVLRRQAELPLLERQLMPSGRVLDLRMFTLPEDQAAVAAARSAYTAAGVEPPRPMPNELAELVRYAAKKTIANATRIPNLSAVRTNQRTASEGRPPRFWYMLPDFAPRHLPLAFVPRVNHHLPWTEINPKPRLLVDANFATFWTSTRDWSAHALKALLNSIWCRAAMEALGTKMGGGALKLEATHLRQLPIPRLTVAHRTQLDAYGKRLLRGSTTVQERIDALVLKSLYAQHAPDSVTDLVEDVRRCATELRSRRTKR